MSRSENAERQLRVHLSRLHRAAAGYEATLDAMSKVVDNRDSTALSYRT